MKRLVIVFMCLSLAIAARAERNSPQRPLENQQIHPLTTHNETSEHYDFAQFGVGYVPPESVEYRARLLTTAEEPILVFYDSDNLTIQWDSASTEWSVSRGPVDAKRLAFDVSDPGWIVWEAVFPGERTSGKQRKVRVGGFITTTYEGSFVVQIESDNGIIRSLTPLRTEGGVALHFVSDEAPAEEGGGGGDGVCGQTSAKCNCFGLGGATSTCTDKKCDEGVSCGKTRSCRWSPAC